MSTPSFVSISEEQQQRLINNTVEALQILYRSVVERKRQEIVSDCIKKFNKNEKSKYGKYKRV